jgi:hypothetical protein
MLTWAALLFTAVATLQSVVCRRIWKGSGVPMPYTVFRAFARRRHHFRTSGPSERERARYGSHFLLLDHPAVVQAHRFSVVTTVIGILLYGLCWPVWALLPV